MSAFQSSHRPSALKDSDYDHEIHLIDHTKAIGRLRSSSASNGSRDDSVAPEDDSRRHSDDQLRKKMTVREELARLRYSNPKYQNRLLGDDLDNVQAQPDAEQGPSVTTPADVEVASEEGRPKTGELSTSKNAHVEQESAIDVLYENQRGCFLCGMPLFSSRALGAADAPPWTNIAQKASATNITNAQVPDPSWEWASKTWVVNHSDEVDADGWEYSFMFSKKFSWHGPSWYNSFVRRRAWIRKRVKKRNGYGVQEAHRLNPNYFTIYPAMARSRSPSKAGSVRDSKCSVNQLARQEMEEKEDREDIHDIEHLMRALKDSRIDRERTEAVENFIKNGGDDLYYLKERMHDIMTQFIFQASRRLLLAHLTTIVEEASRHREEHVKDDKEEDPAEKRTIDYLEAAIKAADEEVKRLEFWSDIKDMVGEGKTKGAVDKSQGWDQKKWAGIDTSGPKDVISDREVLGMETEANESKSSVQKIDKDKEN